MQKNQILNSKLKNQIKILDKKYLFSVILKTFNFFRKFNKRKFKIKPVSSKYGYYINDYLIKDNLLTNLCEKYNSDKGGNKSPFFEAGNNYSDFYYQIFNKNRFIYKKIFECGIGTNNNILESNMTLNGKPGASLRVWKEFFPNAEIYGADIDKNILFSENRINTFYVDQFNTKSIMEMWSDIKQENFDLIIDDGAHFFDANINLYENSFLKLKKSGMYVIEDIRLSELKKFYKYFENSNHNVQFISVHSKSTDGSSNLVVIEKLF
tara:strand:+ start:896 stop:1693 length:798 start_codon:yes stop_codon:yes gene_type:complete